MPDVFRGGGVNRIFGDVGRVIADAFEMARDEHQIQIAAQLVGILRHPLDQAPAGLAFISSSALSRAFRRATQFDILPHIGIDAVLEHLHRLRVHRLDQLRLGQRRMPVQFARLARDAYRLVPHAFEVGARASSPRPRAGDPRRPAETQQHIDPILVDLFLELIDLLVVRDRGRAKIVIALEQAVERVVEAALVGWPSSGRCCARSQALRRRCPEYVSADHGSSLYTQPNRPVM